MPQRINMISTTSTSTYDDLESVAEDNLQARSTEAEKAEEMVRVEAETFVRWMESLEQVPTITALRQRFEDIRRKELEKSLAGNSKTCPGRSALHWRTRSPR